MPHQIKFPMKKINEGSAEIFVPIETKISKKMTVFYNPVMKLNRDITIALLKLLPPMNICDPLAGTGIRAIRCAKELDYESIVANDYSKSAVALIKKNTKHNSVKIEIFNKDANMLLLESNGFDYIDLDVFGSPNFMLDSAIKRISRDGILAVTATDTAPLAGTYPKACKRKYWATPLRNHLMHEVGLRILIRKVQLIATQYSKALIPLFSYSKDHYYRIFFQAQKSKEECDSIIKQHKMLLYCPGCTAHNIIKPCSCKTQIQTAGPLWTGKLHDKKIITNMIKITKEDETKKFLHIIEQEANILGFYDLHLLAKKTRQQPSKTADIIKTLKKKGFIATPTHFSAHAIKTNATVKQLTQ